MLKFIEGLFYGNPSLIDCYPIEQDTSCRYYWWCYGGFVPLDKRKRATKFYTLRGAK